MFRKTIYSIYFYLVILIVLNIFISVFYISPGYEIAKDAITYRDAISFLKGDLVDGRPIYNRILTAPLMLISARVVDFFTNNIYGSMAIINTAFYFLIVFVFYKLALEIFENRRTAFFSSILFFCNYYLINIENAFLTDMAGRFFLILTNLLAVKYF